MASSSSSVPTAEFELRSPPSDGISAIKFNARTPSLLLAASWDKVELSAQRERERVEQNVEQGSERVGMGRKRERES